MCGGETPVAFARWCLCGFETAIAFAAEKWAVLVRFSGAEVTSVSAFPCWGRAVVLLVSPSPCFCVLCAMFVALLGLMWVRARKSSPCVLTMAKSWRLMARWASIFADQQSWDPAGRVCCAVCLAAGPSTGSVNPSMRSYTLLVAWWAARPGHHLSG